MMKVVKYDGMTVGDLIDALSKLPRTASLTPTGNDNTGLMYDEKTNEAYLDDLDWAQEEELLPDIDDEDTDPSEFYFSDEELAEHKEYWKGAYVIIDGKKYGLRFDEIIKICDNYLEEINAGPHDMTYVCEIWRNMKNNTIHFDQKKRIYETYHEAVEQYRNRE